MISTAAKTQPHGYGGYLSRRYGSFAGKGQVDAPDFMHGTINLRPYVLGTVNVKPHLNGSIRVNP